MKSALARPAKQSPQLLALPNRDEVERAFRRGAVLPCEIRGIELERVVTLNGRHLELQIFLRKPDLVLRHLFPERCNPALFVQAAAAMGANAARSIKVAAMRRL